jgi:hypothetical protein
VTEEKANMMLQTALRLTPGHRHRLPDPRRASREQLVREIQAVSQSPVVGALLASVDAILLVLNGQRQIVACNGGGPFAEDPIATHGLRPGEALACVHAQGPGGCGAATACEMCGALGAILGCGDAQAPVESECAVRSDTPPGSGRVLSVRATPLSIEGQPFTVVSLRDVSDEKRRDALEQVFFHDVLNTLAGLRGWVTRLRQQTADLPRVSERIDQLARQLEREILDQRTLVLAERGELVANPVAVRALDLLRDLEHVLSLGMGGDRRLELEVNPTDLELQADRALLRRVLVNMALNALEATRAGGTVRVRAERAPGAAGGAEPGGVIRFSVWNEGVIPPEVQLRIFHRSFSTKAERGRGLGTYGMKLLGERFLGGRVSFSSADGSGTVFSIALPAGSPVAGAAG